MDNMAKISIVGCGNMGEALLAGMLSSLLPKDINFFEINDKRAHYISHTYKIRRSTSFTEIANSSYILLCVKPDGILSVIAELQEIGLKEQVIISIAAGISITKMQSVAEEDIKLVRIMPNTPALIKKGVSAIAQNGNLSSDELAYVLNIFSSVGEVIELDEKHFDAVTGLSGSGPAYVYLFIYSMMQAGIHEGLTGEIAKKLAIETILGAAEMVKLSDEHPSALIDKVSSPGGTTIRALASFEKDGFKNSIINAVKAASKRSQELSG